jgi:type I restriction enzyme, R subunit
MSTNEGRTREEKIDAALLKAGGTFVRISKVGTEITAHGYDAETWNGITDYCRYGENGEE